jgi:predicted enzyme related to lactoylglutathione lyase
MPNPVAHFEIYGDDPEKLAGFYRELFSWDISASGVEGYYSVRTVPTDKQGVPTEPGGINGGLMKRPVPEARAWTNYVTVASLDESVKHATALGGTVLRPKSAAPKMGWFATVADPEMNVFGIWQDDPNAG